MHWAGLIEKIYAKHVTTSQKKEINQQQPQIIMDEKQQLLPSNSTKQGSPLSDVKRFEPESPLSLKRALSFDIFPCIPARYVLAFASCLGFVNVYALRVNLSVAIVQMDNDTATVNRNTSARVFNWSSSQEGWVLSAFFFGYVLTQIPGGWLSERIGGRWIYGIGIVMTAVLTLLTPIAAYVNVWLLVAVRILEGFFEGVTFPSMHAIWAKWAPPAERSRLTTITYAGPHIGNVISFPLSALLCQYGFDGGWPSVFYVFGAVGVLWFVLWLYVGYSSPATHPRISKEEREYIESSIAAEGVKEKVPVPWFQILTSPAVWAIIVAHFCNNWGFYTLLTCMPTYFKQALPQLGYDKQSIVLGGVYSAIPYTLLAIMVATSGQIADFLRARCLSTTVVRKIMTITAFTGAGTFLLICGYFGNTSITSVVFLTLAVGSLGIALAGFNINHLDIAPRFAGVLMGLTNCVATIPGIVGPIVAKALTPKPSAIKGSDEYYDTYRDEWRQVFIISAELYAFGIIVYLLLGSGSKQPWADGVGTNSQQKVIDPEHIEKHLQDSSGTYPGKPSNEKTPLPRDSEWKKITFEPESNYGSVNSEQETN